MMNFPYYAKYTQNSHYSIVFSTQVAPIYLFIDWFLIVGRASLG